jgi:hypothetical protein
VPQNFVGKGPIAPMRYDICQGYTTVCKARLRTRIMRTKIRYEKYGDQSAACKYLSRAKCRQNRPNMPCNSNRCRICLTLTPKVANLMSMAKEARGGSNGSWRQMQDAKVQYSTIKGLSESVHCDGTEHSALTRIAVMYPRIQMPDGAREASLAWSQHLTVGINGDTAYREEPIPSCRTWRRLRRR